MDKRDNAVLSVYPELGWYNLYTYMLAKQKGPRTMLDFEVNVRICVWRKLN